jgi:hypothetical protein
MSVDARRASWRGGAGEFGRIGARLDQRHLDAEAGDFLRQTLVKRLERLFGGVVEACGRGGVVDGEFIVLQEEWRRG